MAGPGRDRGGASTPPLTCATDAKMMRGGRPPGAGAAAGAARARGGRDGGARWAPGVAGVRVGDAVVVANSAPCGALPRLPPRGGRTCVRGSSTSPGPSPSACACRRRSWPATCCPAPTGWPPSWRPRRSPWRARVHAADRAGRGRRATTVLVLGGGVQGQLLAGLLARARRAGCTWPTRTPSGASARCASGAERAHRRAARRGRRGARCGRRCPAAAAPTLVIEAVGRPETWAHRRRPRAPRRRGAAARRVRGGQRGDAPHGPPALRGAHASRLLSPHARGACRRALAMLEAGDARPWPSWWASPSGSRRWPTVLAAAAGRQAPRPMPERDRREPYS